MNAINDELARQTIIAAFEVANRLEDDSTKRVLTTIRATECGVDFGVRAMVPGRYKDRVFTFKPGDTRRWMLSLIEPWVRESIYLMTETP